MKKVRTEQAIGKILCHDITKIVPGEFKGRIFKKGHTVRKEDIEELLNCGKSHLYVWEESENIVHENEAAQRIAKAIAGDGIKFTEPDQGRVSLLAGARGRLKVDVEKLEELNSIEKIAIATLHGNYIMKEDQVLAGTRVIPLVIDKVIVEKVEKTIEEPIIQLQKLISVKYGLITTGSEVYSGRIKDAFGPVVKEKLSNFDCEFVEQIIVPDEIDAIEKAITQLIDKGVNAVFITGGMSVDPDDLTPTAIRSWGAEIVSYGTPVLPGSMLLVAYHGNIPIIGMPGCVMYSKRTVFDLILPKILVGEVITKSDIVKLGYGGLCTECEMCKFPNCSFGKGR
ncbi:molybdenum cofactor synthesis domain-containing protein [Desulfitispora alkaliphila]|uniref:molybdopterin-binding protein n=1 Tax=Desulfitispora alkaliphila TaxID=622674 RepID=UPI003D1DC0D4